MSIIIAIGLFGVVAIEIMSITQEAEARGCINENAPGGGSIAVNASKGRCVQ
jgi:hypothetical protein